MKERRIQKRLDAKDRQIASVELEIERWRSRPHFPELEGVICTLCAQDVRQTEDLHQKDDDVSALDLVQALLQ